MSTYRASAYVASPAPQVLRQDRADNSLTHITWGEAVAKVDGAATPLELRDATPARPVRTALADYWTAR